MDSCVIVKIKRFSGFALSVPVSLILLEAAKTGVKANRHVVNVKWILVYFVFGNVRKLAAVIGQREKHHPHR